MLNIILTLLKVFAAIVLAIMLIWSGSYISFLYYLTDQNIHWGFSWAAPMLVVGGIGHLFIAYIEVKQ